MSPIEQRHAAMDDVANYAAQRHAALPTSGRESLASLSYERLTALEGELSEDGDWDAHGDVLREMKHRLGDAKLTLSRRFFAACQHGGQVPVPSAGKVVDTDIADVVREVMGTNWGTELGLELILHASARASVVARMAQEFADDNAETLLCAGWEVAHG